MAGLTLTRKAPCVAGVSIWDPTTCQLLPDSYVFKPSGDTPVERSPEYFDDQDWTEYATDQSQCGPALVKRGDIKREEVTISRCQISFDMEAAMKGAKARLLTDIDGNTTGYVDTQDPSQSICSTAAKPAILFWIAYPIGQCGTSGYCASAAGGCVVEGFWWGLEPRVTTRNAQAVADPASFSFWAYGIAAEAAANLPAGLAALTNGVNANDTHFETTVDCALVPSPNCETVPTASLFT